MDASGPLRASAARLPDGVALVDGAERVTYGELESAVQRTAAALQELGLAPGERVGLLLPNSTDFVVALYGVWRAGLVAVPLNTGAPGPEIARILADAQPSLVIAHPELAGALGAVEVRLVTTGPEWDARVEGAGAGRAVEVAAEEVALIPYTSGTTGEPRGVLLTHAAVLANQEQMAATRLRVEERDSVLCVLPLFHVYALNVALAFPLTRGATVVLLDRFDPHETLGVIVRERISVLVGAPPIYAAFAAAAGGDGTARPDLASVRVAVSGAARLPPAVAARFAEDFGITIWEGYGLTETAPLVTTSAMTDVARPGSVGRPVPGVELRLLDRRGREVSQGDPGEVHVRGPNVFAGYWNAPKETAAVLSDGWFATGDIGYLDDGELFLVDRKKDLVIVNGFNVYPLEVEEALLRHPDLVGAAVIGVPDERTGETVKAVVVRRGGTTMSAEDVIAHCRGLIARFKCPTVVEFTDALPLLPSGKLRRVELRDA